MLIKLLSSSLSTSDVRVRIPASLEADILEFAGVEKFSQALPVLEQVVALEASIRADVEAGCRFYEQDASGEKCVLKFVFGGASVSGASDIRVRITTELHDYILECAGKKRWNNALPHLQSCLNLAKMLMAESKKGSKFMVIGADQEPKQVGFAL